MTTDEIKNMTDNEIATLIGALQAEVDGRKPYDYPDYYPVEMGYLDQGPLGYEREMKGFNTIATVWRDPGFGWNLVREFWEPGVRSYRKLPANLAPGQIIEVTCAYLSGSGGRRRFYYQVVAIHRKPNPNSSSSITGLELVETCEP